MALASLNTHGRPASVDGGFFTSGDGLEHQPEDAHTKPRRLQKHIGRYTLEDAASMPGTPKLRLINIGVEWSFGNKSLNKFKER